MVGSPFVVGIVVVAIIIGFGVGVAFFGRRSAPRSAMSGLFGRLGILVNLIQLLLTLYAALIVFVLGVLLPVALIARIPVINFLKAVIEPMSIAFATTSSESALPKAMQAMERLGVPRKIVAFVIPTGYSFNLDGTTLYLSLASIFVAQAAGMHMDVPTQILLVFTLMLTSKGVAGVPRASLVIIKMPSSFW